MGGGGGGTSRAISVSTIFWVFSISLQLLSKMKDMEFAKKSNKFSHNDLITECLWINLNFSNVCTILHRTECSLCLPPSHIILGAKLIDGDIKKKQKDFVCIY